MRSRALFGRLRSFAIPKPNPALGSSWYETGSVSICFSVVILEGLWKMLKNFFTLEEGAAKRLFCWRRNWTFLSPLVPVPTYWEKKSLVYQKCYPGIGINIEAKHKNKKIPFLFGTITTGAESRSREPEPTKNRALRRCCASWQVKHVYLYIILITWCRPWSGAWWERGGSCCWQDGGWTRLLLQQKDHFNFLRLLGL